MRGLLLATLTLLCLGSDPHEVPDLHPILSEDPAWLRAAYQRGVQELLNGLSLTHLERIWEQDFDTVRRPRNALWSAPFARFLPEIAVAEIRGYTDRSENRDTAEFEKWVGTTQTLATVPSQSRITFIVDVNSWAQITDSGDRIEKRARLEDVEG